MRARSLASLLAVVSSVVGSGCGSHDLGQSTAAASQAPPRTTLYLLADGGTVPLGVRRELARRPGAVTARLALEALLAGPSDDERAGGLTTAIPARTALRSLMIERRARGSEAFVDLGGLPSADEADAVLKVRVMTQVARTLIGLNDIARVWLRGDGAPWGLWDLEGNIRDDPIDYERLRGFFHICTAKPGTEAVPADCFTALP